MDREEEIRKIEEEIRKTPYNKATQFHIGRLKAKLARLRHEKKAGKRGEGFGVKKTGDATVILIGFPSVGKSTLLNKITNADSKTGDYDFTTLNIVPGVLEYNGARIQVLDIPGLIEGMSGGRGRGREILSVVRIADLLVLILEPKNLNRLGLVEEELYKAGFRLNQEPPDVKIVKRFGGGVEIGSGVKLTKLNRGMVRAVLQEFRVLNAEVTIREDISVEQLIDCVLGNRVYIPSVVIVNKSDLLKEEEKEGLKGKGILPVSALKGENIEKIKEIIWIKLGLIRVYLKRAGKPPDLKEPLIMKKPVKVADVCLKIHGVFKERFRFARVWGSSRFPGQKLGSDFVLKDRDIVEIHLE